jgi:hydroxypyruvate isomerase
VHTHGHRFDVNCSILFTALPLLKRPAAARPAGFDAVEFWWPFAEPVPPDHEVDQFALFGQLAAQGYAGWIGCEFKPSDPADSTTSFGCGDRSCRPAR